jgi:hypothetical protein
MENLKQIEEFENINQQEKIRLLKLKIAKETDSADVLELLSLETEIIDIDMQMKIVMNKHTSSSTLELLAISKFKSVQQYIATHPNVNETILDSLVESKHRDMLELILKNNKTTTKTLEKIWLKIKNSTSDMFGYGLLDSVLYQVTLLANHHNVSNKILQELVSIRFSGSEEVNQLAKEKLEEETKKEV